MSVETRSFAVTVPHGTLSTAPQITALTMPARIVRWIEVEVPPGPSGFVGFRIGAGGTQLFPVNTGAWLITDDRTLRYDVSNAITSGAWQLIAYNTGTYDHVLTVTFGLDLTQLLPGSTFPATIDQSALSGSTELPN